MSHFVKNHIFFLFFLFSYYSILSAQNSEWIIYDTTNSVLPSNQINIISIDHNNTKWIGTPKGLVKFDGNNWQIYNSINSLLPSSFITSIYADEKGVWVGTDSGLVHFDGINWEKFDEKDTLFNALLIIEIIKDKEDNYWAADAFTIVKIDKDSWNILVNIPGGNFQSIAVDNNNHLWYGEFDHLQFNGMIWDYFNNNWIPYKLNKFPELISSFPYSISVDKNNIVWLGAGGTSGGTLVKIENSNWTLFRRSNSGFNGSGIKKVVIEDSIKWMGTGSGLTSFDNVNWTNFNSLNSELPDDNINSLAIDSLQNKWIGTLSGGLVVYKNGGVTTSIKKNNIYLSEFYLHQNYPNPFNPSTKISYSIPQADFVKLEIYNVLGQKIKTLVNEFQEAENYTISFNAYKLSSGVYFYKLSSGNYSETKKMLLIR